MPEELTGTHTHHAMQDRAWPDPAFDDMPIGVAFFDHAGQLCHANRRFIEAMGGTRLTLRAMERQGWRSFSEEEFAASTPALRLPGEAAFGPASASNGTEHRLGTIVLEQVGNRLSELSGPTKADERMRRFVEHSNSAIVITDLASGRHDFVSPAARRFWSSCPRFETAQDWIASIHPDDRAEALNKRERAASGTPQHIRYRIIDARGETSRHLRETCFVMPSHDGEASALGGIVEDISTKVHIYLVQMQGDTNREVLTELRKIGNQVTFFSAYEDYMNVADVLSPGCVLVDMRFAPPPQHLLLQLLSERPSNLEVILIGSPDTKPRDVINALKAGAADYLVTAGSRGELLCAVDAASRLIAGASEPADLAADALNERLALLSKREREVFLHLVQGETNKTIARALGLSPRTVETYRANVMQRLNLRNLTELLHLARDAGIRSVTP